MSVLELTSDEYHADPCDTPSLNSTTARILLTRTPAHAKAQHPRLWDEPPQRRQSDAFDLGTAVHQLLLKDDRVDVHGYPDWRTGEAKAARDMSRAAGRIPMLTAQWESAQTVANRIRERLTGLTEPVPFTAGTPEATITWEDVGGAMCRARLDWLRDDLEIIDDLKTTSKTADPLKWEADIFRYGYDVQAAFYLRGLRAYLGDTSHPHPTAFRWFVVEVYPPYAVSMVQLSEHALFVANAKVERAIAIWNQCLERNEWPAYDTETHVAEIPSWMRDAADPWAQVDPGDEAPF